MKKHCYARLKLVTIFAVFVIPFGIASYLADNVGEYDVGTSNKGELLNPPIAINKLEISAHTDADSSLQDFTNHWTFLFWNDGQCNLQCESNLFKMRQARLMLGREASRVSIVYLIDNNDIFDDGFKQLAINYPKLTGARLHKKHKELSNLTKGRIYIVDPLGNIIMAYSQGVYTRDILSDIKWLIKVSRIG